MLLKILELLLFLPSIYFYINAQNQLNILQSLESQDEIIVHYVFTSSDSSIDLPEILVRFPKIWQPGEEREVIYEIQSWNHPEQNVEFAFLGIPDLSNMGTPITFIPFQMNKISKKIVLPKNHPYTGLTHVKINGYLEMGSYQAYIEPESISIIDQATIDVYDNAYKANKIIFWIWIILASLIFILWW